MSLSQYSIDDCLQEGLFGKQLDPTQEEISRFLYEISYKYHHLDPLTIVSRLYSKMLQLKPQIASLPPPSSAFSYSSFLKRQIARSFYFFGHGYTKFSVFLRQRHLSLYINEQFYTSMCEGVILYLYRSLQRMLIRNGFRIRLKHYEKVRELSLSAIDSKRYMDPVTRGLLLKLTAKVYSIQEVYFSMEEAQTLYCSLQKRFGGEQSNPILDQYLGIEEDYILDDSGLEQLELLDMDYHGKEGISHEQDQLKTGCGGQQELQGSSVVYSLSSQGEN